MESAITFNAIGPALGFLGGVAASLLGSYLQHRWAVMRDDKTWTREREHRLEERKEVRALKQLEFQAETLLKLQESVNDLARNLNIINLADLKAYRETGAWGQRPHDEQLGENCRVSMRACSILGSRIADDSIRQIVDEIRSLGSNVIVAKNQKDAESAMDNLSYKVIDSNNLIGNRLRDISSLSLDKLGSRDLQQAINPVKS